MISSTNRRLHHEEAKMKAEKNFREEWEEANLLRLFFLAELINAKFFKYKRSLVVALSFAVFILFRLLKGLSLAAKILLFSEPQFLRVERDESWIFRQIK